MNCNTYIACIGGKGHLGATQTTHGRVGGSVGAADAPDEAHVRDSVCVIRMQQGLANDSLAHVKAPAPVAEGLCVQRPDLSIPVEANLHAWRIEVRTCSGSRRKWNFQRQHRKGALIVQTLPVCNRSLPMTACLIPRHQPPLLKASASNALIDPSR